MSIILNPQFPGIISNTYLLIQLTYALLYDFWELHSVLEKQDPLTHASLTSSKQIGYY